jgi:hypothetical protein
MRGAMSAFESKADSARADTFGRTEIQTVRTGISYKFN